MRKLAIVIVVAALLGSTAAVSVRHQRRWTEKLDAALVHTAEEGSGDLVQLLVRVRPGTTERILSHLAHHGLKPEAASSPDVIAVRMPGAMLRSIGGDPDVVHVSQMQ